MSDTTLSDERLAQIEQRANAATQGPWRIDILELAGGDYRAVRVEPSVCRDVRPEDAAFIAEARDAVPQLIDEVRRLRAANDALRLALVRQDVER